ncbi:hypothetical protein GbCGDNIH3_7005 [Granulibacter bethesdensis]|uniref:Uncharacterized protein n=1 Tax=Granulibacter bethesdensis TaxID=364410 RepID=A0AAN0REI6_9PROT|nr:hypothetical protein GbCGDNIH3_7005 [Granulibacter bethesdensis]
MRPGISGGTKQGDRGHGREFQKSGLMNVLSFLRWGCLREPARGFGHPD